MSRTALFVVDIQHALALSPSTSIPHARRIVDAGTSILAKARATIDAARSINKDSNVEIVIVQHEERPEQGNLQRGTQAWDLVFPPRENDGCERLVGKAVRDTFESNPELADELKERDVGTIVAFGIQSECCVLSTCRGALAAGFRVVLLRGAHSTYDADGKTAAEIEGDIEGVLEHEGVEVVDWESWSPGA